ncbi:CocE/NonD family hydrolase [Actinocorallia longicatena]|uniref:CocE/NonD family hydrolase n=1 Tax=Actinocorallia longicatena TaxID=111803 RepID=A0ABP6QFB5_9ACTN
MRPSPGAKTAAVALLSSASLLGTLTTAVPAVAASGFTSTYETISGYGGTPIKALVFQPEGKGPFPLLVMPSSWSLFHAEYAGAAARLARDSGYVVVSYTSRGFWDSEGRIEIAGKPDVNDMSKVIDWAVTHTRSDAKRIGAAGISYGAGISLLGAAFDPRIRAVAAMSAWADLPDSLFVNETVSEQTAAALLLLGHVTGRPGPDYLTVQDGYIKDDFGTAVKLAEARGASRYVDRLNASGPAVLIANGWQDGMFPPGQITDFFNRLRTPKRLMFQPGDHGTADGAGAVGLPNDVWAAATRWFDHHLRGKPSDGKGDVVLKANSGGPWRSFPAWTAQSGRTLKYTLSGGGTLTRKKTGWKRTIATGVPTVADSGVIEGTGAAAQAGIHWTIRPSQVSRKDGLVFRGPKLGRTTTIGGFPRLRTTVTPSARNTSFFVYLYDEAPGGKARLVTHIPYTLRDVRPGVAKRLDLRLQPIRWTLARGHRLTLVVDTMDVRYRSTSRKGGTLTFSATAAEPSSVTLPTS